ncbi:glycosyltransferase, partial [uncultured Fibrobacter sp.]|uniref:glycosyltransferase n=1 Tax=uncultured Fibrobacter sp. TaxID=261512 RepID=UPI0025DF5B7D
SSGFIYAPEKRQKEIIYCGRIDFNQKRVYRLIDVWSFLEPIFPDWRLTIVGDGDARKDVENRANTLKLQRVSFEGFQKPIEYYKRASILALTSEYEGFPLVLAECMSFGVVPCVYDSFAAVRDIIVDGENGLIVEKEGDKFSAKEMASRLTTIMSDGQKLDAMAQRAIETSKRYSIDSVYEQWINNLNRLMET